jgi:hypothetical protein
MPSFTLYSTLSFSLHLMARQRFGFGIGMVEKDSSISRVALVMKFGCKMRTR